MLARVLEAHLDCAQHWERIPSWAPQVWKRLSGWKKTFSGTAIPCFVCAVTPVRSLLHTLTRGQAGFLENSWGGGGGEHGVRF